MNNLKVDQLLEIVSNQHRRTILRLLTEKERYAFELTKVLDISQRAVRKHLDYLQNLGLVKSEKRKSSKGPEREYFMLDQAVIFSLTIAPNLFLAAVRPLSDKAPKSPITPSYQLNPPNVADGYADDVIKEGLLLLPQIREALDLLQAEQSKILRGYQGLQGHVSDKLKSEGYTSDEIRFLLKLLENDGVLSTKDIKFIYGDFSSILDIVNSLVEKDIIYTELEDKVSMTVYLNKEFS